MSTDNKEQVDRQSELAHKLSEAVRERCDNVPHDIGLTLLEIVQRHFYGASSHDVVATFALRHMVRQWCNGEIPDSELRNWFRAFHESDG